MKKLFLFIALFFAAAQSYAQSPVYVSGYTRSNGTYVEGHYRTAPNYTRNDNYSTVGNVNPYTGTYGTKPRDGYYVAPTGYSTSTYSTPSYSSSSYSTSTYSTPSYYSTPTYSAPTPVYTGPRGGNYYINSNGNKTYLRR
ncbi:MAG: hypothetical protein CFE24_13205 [Flavobacterium sp. BFFFF2]|nr:MAG: hypothetical protein CFE24_13205 [Flavobacterium sp. BFFFF2]